MTPGICVIIHKSQYNEEALDFILAASNLSENITVIFTQEGVLQINQYKALKGFEINNIYIEKESVEKYKLSLDLNININNINKNMIQPKLISQDELKNYVTHCQQIFTF